ncbi:MAG: AAA family ATPase, partial [Anaerolineales bacterium]|nr:AAA family ATPase [Anaerolineales bacterium]
SAKLRPLLGYLILHHGRPVERQRLADFLWPDSDEAAGRRNLREYLYRARQTLDEFAAAQELLITDDRFAILTLPENCWVDLFDFQDKLTQAQETFPPQQKIELLEAAQALYRDDLLRDFYEDWADSERERVRTQIEESYAQLAELYKATANYTAALKAAQQAVNFDPLREEHQRRLMELYALSGDRAQALQQYKQLKERLGRELAIEPMAETTELADAIISGAYKLQTVAPLTPPAAAPAVAHNHFTNFVGRQAELARLNLLFEQRPQNAIDTVVIRGDSGVGKTRLVGHWLSQLPPQTIILQGRGHEFETSIPYRPLLDAIQRVLPQVPWSTLPSAAAHTWLAPLAQLLPDLYFHLPDLPPAAPTAEIETSYMMEGLAQIVLSLARQGLASQRPLVLFLDDLHWADMATWRFLTFLSRRVEGLALLMVCTFSSSESTAEARNRLWALERAGRTQILQLARLWPNDTAQMVAQTLAADVQAVNRFTQKLHQMTDGNPFFATEIMRTLTESDLPKPYTAAS